MKLKEFIEKFMDGKTRVDIFDFYSTDEETVHYTGHIENLERSPEDYTNILDMFVEHIDSGKNGILLILLNKEEK